MTSPPETLAATRLFAVEVVRRLRAAGHEAYWAGGCVRDLLAGRTPKDYDVATAARPEEVVALFGAKKAQQVGAAFGVVMVKGKRPADPIEVATFREDGLYSDGRRPDRVSYSDARRDAQRRDFTINGMFLDPLTDEVHDFVGGREDLARRVVRAIGDPAARIAEDRLRTLRAVRFASSYGFAIEPATLAAIQASAPRVTTVSPERIQAELRRMLVAPSRAVAARSLRESALLPALAPELSDAAADEGSPDWRATLVALESLRDPSFPLALATLLHRARPAPAAAVAAVTERWKMSNQESDLARWLTAEQGSLRGVRARPWSTIQRTLAKPAAGELVALFEAALAAEEAVAGVEDPAARADAAWCRARLAEPRRVLDPPPLVTGADLLADGIPAGPVFKTLLELARDAQLDGLVGDRTAAMDLVRARLAAEAGGH